MKKLTIDPSLLRYLSAGVLLALWAALAVWGPADAEHAARVAELVSTIKAMLFAIGVYHATLAPGGAPPASSPPPPPPGA